VLGLAVAACGSASTHRSVASLPGRGSTTGAAGPLTLAQSDQDMIGFTRCMRAHGVQMSDPYHRPGHQGLSIDLPERGTASSAAYTACGHYMAPIIAAKDAAGASASALDLQALTDYARCMRSHDISMLDPGSQGQLNLGNVPGISGDFGRYSPQFRDADTACRHLLPAGVHDDGTGP
jgi:hypothetical protein